MRKLCILCISVLLCIAVCFPAYADLVLPDWPPEYSTVTEPQTEVSDPIGASSTTTIPETTTKPSDNPSPIRERLHAIWAAVVAAAVAVAAFLAKLFHKK